MGVAAGIVARMKSDYGRDRNFNLQKEAAIDQTSNSPQNIINTAFNLEADWGTEIEQRQGILASTELQYPRIAYNREMSKWMIQSCKLAVQQYKTARSNSKYNGELTFLPDYNANFHNYQQLASFQIEQEIIEDYWQLQESILTDDADSMEKMLHDAESNIRAIVRRIVQRKHRTPVFVGFAIASKQGNIIAFWGTQTQIEWWRNLQATQQDYADTATGKTYGRVHQGYLKIVREQMGEMLIKTIRQLDPTIPCYITGHSLGGAIATLSAMEIALKVPGIREQIQLYTYAAPRIALKD